MKVAVIGGGPAGIIAAGFAGKRNETYLFEQNEKLGKKLYITGKGRCNLTNNRDISDFFDMIVNNSKFLYSAFYSFTNKDLISLIEKYGVKTKVERGDRVYPSSDKSSDILKALNRFLEESKVNIQLNTKVLSIKKDGNFFHVKTDKEKLKFDKVIIATGGVSYPVTGSRGDGISFSKDLGIKTRKLRPGLTPILCKNKFISSLEGVSLKNVSLSLLSNDKKIKEEMGEALFTDGGISGPIALTISSYIEEENKIQLYLDLKPAMTLKDLDNRLLRDLDKNSNKDIINALSRLTTGRLVPVLIERAEIPLSKKCHQITREERQALANMVKKFPLDFKGLEGFDQAIITRGGVDIKEIDPSTMETKKIKGLYIVGEVLDLDALTGGFNLQIAFSTGYLAGVSC